MTASTRLFAMCLVLALSACADNPFAPAAPDSPAAAPAARSGPVPDAAQVAVIKVSDFSINAAERPVRDRAAIQDTLDFIRARSGDWTRAPGTFPTPKQSAAFYDGDGTMRLVVWFGKDWMGVTEFDTRPNRSMLWALAPKDRKELKRLLGIKG